ncbi:ADP-ribosylglycohydrolase family protein [Symmachiella dynata]|uniref:ADP-ribosylglycohydrolase family protein n=1 Tax=Symmachiella dynata TaxID=2527995 RepID=UPI0030EEC579
MVSRRFDASVPQTHNRRRVRDINISLHDRIQGCILGGAIGDAFGAPYEGVAKLPDEQPKQLWRITDDTQLTLATCEGILATGQVEPAEIANQFCRWYQARRLRGLGSSTLKALRDLAAGGHWAVAGATGEYAAGNGAAMRIAPLAFLLDPNEDLQRQKIRDVCFITHRHDEAYIGALAVVRAIRSIAFAEVQPGGEFLLAIASTLPDSRVRDQLSALATVPQEIPLSELGRRFGNSGYVAESVPLAMFAAQRIASLSFMDVLHEAVSAGGDTGTIASISGQIAGTFVGVAGLPTSAIGQLAPIDDLAVITARFASAVAT